MSCVEVISVREQEKWLDVLRRTAGYDFYFLPAYHELAQQNDEGEGILFVYRSGDRVIALPMLMRTIPVGDGGYAARELRDTSSVYGYGGPLASDGITAQDVHHFTAALDEFFRASRVVTAFTRLHPLLNQAWLFGDLGQIETVGRTVSIDLSEPPEQQWAHYRQNHRRGIRRLRRSGFTCDKVGWDHVEEFVTIYRNAMSDLQADPYYHFSCEYLRQLITCMPDTIHLFVCRQGSRTACAGLFSLCGGVVQYHLSGTVREFRDFAPAKMLLDSVREWANLQGARVFHLGGGKGANPDALFNFKLGFASKQHDFAVWKHIVDQDIYQRLCGRHVVTDRFGSSDSYFPAYRRDASRHDARRESEACVAPEY